MSTGSWRALKYTLLLEPAVPDRYARSDLVRSHAAGWFSAMDSKWQFYNLRTIARFYYIYYFRRAPVFVAGTWVGSRLVWALEDAVGEDRMMRAKKPIMVASGFAALYFVYGRGTIAVYARTPILAFVGAFSFITLANALYMGRKGVDAVWNPAGLKLPPAAVAFLSGDPFNGGLIWGPVKYVTLSTLNTTGLMVYGFANLIGDLLGKAKEALDPKPKDRNGGGGGGGSPGDAANSQYLAKVNNSISVLEEAALQEQGFVFDQESQAKDAFLETRKEKAKLLSQFENSAWNPLRYMSAFQDRLSQNGVEFIKNLFGDRVDTVISPFFIPKPTNEVIFGNLNEGIIQSTSSEYVEAVRRQLEANAAAEKPTILGIDSKAGFFSKELIVEAMEVGELFVLDPVGVLLAPATRMAYTLLNWKPLRSQYAFDDQRNAKQPYSSSPAPSLAAASSSPYAYSSPAVPSFEDDLPIPYDLPPLLPPEVAQRQAERILAERASHFSFERNSAKLNSIVNDQVPVALMKAGQKVAKGTTEAGGLATEVASVAFDAVKDYASEHFVIDPTSTTSETSTPPIRNVTAREMFFLQHQRDDMAELASSRYIPDDELFRIIKESADTRAALPSGMTAEQRLMNFVESVGGRDFDEPSDRVAALKMPLYRRRFRFRRTIPILGDRPTTYIKELVETVQDELEVRQRYVTRLPGIFGKLRGEYEAQIAAAAAAAAQPKAVWETVVSENPEAIDRLNRLLVNPTKQWFKEFVGRWNKDK
jgi:hypothetical protein